jgi:hypothetical protein
VLVTFQLSLYLDFTVIQKDSHAGTKLAFVLLDILQRANRMEPDLFILSAIIEVGVQADHRFYLKGWGFDI